MALSAQRTLSATLKGWLPCFLLILTAHQTFCFAAEARISLAAQDMNGMSIAAVFSESTQGNYIFGHDLIQNNIQNTQPLLLLRDIPITQAKQALAFSLNCWWSPRPDGTVFLSQSNKLSVNTALSNSVRSYGPENGSAMLPLVRQLLEPWLVDQASIDYMGHTWSATLSPEGLQHFHNILACLESPKHPIPMLAEAIHLPSQQAHTTSALYADSWNELFINLHRKGCAGISVRPQLLRQPFSAPITIPKCTLRDIPRHLQKVGVQAAWIHGILCCDLATENTQLCSHTHPAWQRVIVRLPVLSDPLTLATIHAQISQRHQDLFSQPDFALYALAHNNSLLIAAPPHDVKRIITWLEQKGLE